MKRIRVIVGEFEDLTALGLRAVTGDDPSVEVAADGVPLAALPEAIERHDPNVALLNFGALASPIAVRDLHERYPETRLVVLANRPTAAECSQLLSLGATACVSKETQARDIVNAIHLASRGLHVMPRTANGEPARGEPDLLTAREAGVLELLQAGMTNGEIAHNLSIGVETVRTHARNIYRKLGVSSRRDLGRLRAATPPVPSAAGRAR